ncbi:hypothetical protein [Xenorhabdus sp. BG5]|uniref:hypothetical protein n=1 Tax=Xenorhabdus sp. BG5 TaxID=2782014 RepID=UPI0018827857|nr:hypothetical protein [Xenorhabdus sp. BG5]MBE8598227.1 hypothetical protein [Xenorhabdus sp. BG5]
MNIPKVTIEIPRKSAKEFCYFHDDEKLADEDLIYYINEIIRDALNDTEFPVSEIKTNITDD